MWGTEGPRLLDAGERYRLVVTTAPLSLYRAGEIEANLHRLDWVAERATEHEAVVEHVMRLGTVVPMNLFTLFTGDDRAVAHVRKMSKTLDRVVSRVGGCEEWALSVVRDRRCSEGSPGLADEVRRLLEGVSKYARVIRHRAPPAGGGLSATVLVDAVLLVPHESGRGLKTTVTKSARRLVPEGFEIGLSGPWPTYSFIERR
jgi:hypothetical protein